MKAKKALTQKLEFHTEADRKKYLQKLEKDYKEQDSGVLEDTLDLIKYLNAGKDHEPHPALGSAELVFGGASFVLQLMNTELNLIQLPFLVGAALVAGAGANNLNDKSTYRGPFMSILSVLASPLILTGVSINKLVKKIQYNKSIKEAKTCKLVPVSEEQLEEDKELFSKDIHKSIDSLEQSKAQVLDGIIREVEDLESLILKICSPIEAEQYMQELTSQVSILFAAYKNGFIKAEDMLKVFQERTCVLRNQAELTKMDEYMEDTSIPAFQNPHFLELTQKHLERQNKEAD